MMEEAYVSQGAGLPAPDVWPEVSLHLNSRPSGNEDDWFVVLQSFTDVASAQKLAVKTNAQFDGFVARIYPNSQKPGNFVVGISSNLSHEKAVALRAFAASKGLTKATVERHHEGVP